MQELFDLFGKIGVDTGSVMKEFEKVEKAGQDTAKEMERAFDKLSDHLKDIDLSVDMDAKDVLKELEKVEKAAVETGVELKSLDGKVVDIDVKKALKETEKLEQQAKDLAKQIEKDMRLGLDVGNAEAELNDVISQIKKVESAAKDVKAKVTIDSKGAETGASRIVAALDKVEQKAKSVQERMQQTGDSINQTGQNMRDGMGPAAAAIGGALIVAVKKSADFDTAMRKAGAIANASAEELDKMRESALNLGATTSLSASEVANAMTEMAAKGFTATQVISAMPGVISAAEASGEDLAIAADTVASALNIFGLKASDANKVADILAQTANSTAAGITDMQYALKYAGPPAAALGVSLEETSAAVGLMTNAGMKGEQAGTTLRAALLALLDPSKENAKMMDSMGIAITDASGNFVGISQLIENISSSMDGMTDAQKAATLSSLVGTEAVSGMLSLMDAGPEKIDKMTASLEKSGGASKKAADEMKAGIGGALENLSGAFDSFLITYGDQLVPYVQKAAKWLTDLTNKFTALPDAVKKNIVIITAVIGILAGLGTVLGFVMMGLGAFISAFSGIAGLFGGFIGMIGKVAGAFSKAFGFLKGIPGLFGRIGPAIVRFALMIPRLLTPAGLAITAFSLLFTFFGKDIVAGLKNGLSGLSNFKTWLLDGIRKGIEAFKSFLGIASPSKLFHQFGVWIIQGLINGIRSLIGAVAGIFSSLFNTMRNAASTALNALISFVAASWNRLKALTQALASFLRSVWTSIFNYLAATARKILFAIRSAFLALKNAVVNIITILWNWLKMIWTVIFNFLRTIAARIKNTVVQAFTALKNGVVQVLTVMRNFIVSVFNRIISAAKAVGRAIISGIVNAFKTALNAAKKFINVAKQLGSDVIGGIVRGIKSGAKLVKKAMGDIVDGAISSFKKKFGIASPSKIMKSLSKWVPVGAAEGIDDGAPAVEQAMSDMVDLTNAEADFKWNIPEPDTDFAQAIAGNIPVDPSFNPVYRQSNQESSGNGGMTIEQLILQVQNLPTLQELENLKQELQNQATNVFFRRAVQME
ncbi:phage tail tape measure protein [Domibacillus antri]|uniref:Phage tail tape measure protein n=1 Tax=Domibacillus antri TaxID=1714264 RepID=A0A1Q8Q338_9BACI|nr:phage tail tape measure protein [Domibacillus antri]OLN21705.1 phage tail tape measure protein [Domibacillus antri]